MLCDMSECLTPEIIVNIKVKMTEKFKQKMVENMNKEEAITYEKAQQLACKKDKRNIKNGL